jgi:hypothetical protein
MRLWKFLVLCLVVLPLVVGAETITWTLPTTYTDNTTISAADKARITVYLRGYKSGSPAAKTYFGETRNGAATWGVAGDNTYIMNKMNQWAATNAVPGWVNIVPGDNVLVTVSAAITWTDNGVVREFDGPESAPYAWTIYKAPPPPVPTPSCTAPSGITIKP